jgi:hypothetical protein
MKPDIASFIIPRDMKALGYGENDYITNYRHFVVKAGATLNIKGENEYYYLLEKVKGITLKSPVGIYDLSDTSINELQSKHQGNITVKNNSNKAVGVRFVQVIPKQK